jgi:hypothetical protein
MRWMVCVRTAVPVWTLHSAQRRTLVYVIRTLFLECRALAYVVSRWPFTAETSVRFQASPCGVWDGGSRTGTGLLSEYFGFPLPLHSAIAACSLRHLLPIPENLS